MIFITGMLFAVISVVYDMKNMYQSKEVRYENEKKYHRSACPRHSVSFHGHGGCSDRYASKTRDQKGSGK
jgi:hypothetical protein